MTRTTRTFRALAAAGIILFFGLDCGGSDGGGGTGGVGATGGTGTGGSGGTGGTGTGGTGGSTGSGACARMPPPDGTISIAGANSMGFGTSPAKILVSQVANNRNVTWNGGFESRVIGGMTMCRSSASIEILGPTYVAGKVIKVVAPDAAVLTMISAFPAVPMGASASDYASAYVHEFSDAEKTMSVLSKRVSYRGTGGTVTVKSIVGKVVTLTLAIEFKKVEAGAVTGDIITVTGDVTFETF